MRTSYVIVFAAMLLSSIVPALAQHEVESRPDVEYVQHDGVRLTGDLDLPKGVAKAPVIVGVHGGGW